MLNHLEADNHVERLVVARDIPAVIEAEIDVAITEALSGILYRARRNIEGNDLPTNFAENSRPIPIITS